MASCAEGFLRGTYVGPCSEQARCPAGEYRNQSTSLPDAHEWCVRVLKTADPHRRSGDVEPPIYRQRSGAISELTVCEPNPQSQ